MTRPTILDLGLVVVPSKADVGMLGAWYRYKSGHRFAGEEPARDTSDVGAYTAMLSASPYPTAWDDVRKYVEKLEVEARCDEEYLDLVKEKYRAAESRIAELEKCLADAERVIEPFAAVEPMNVWHETGDDEGYHSLTENQFRAARAYMEGK